MRYTFVSDSIETNQEGWVLDNFEASTAIIDAVDDLSQSSLNTPKIVLYPNPVEDVLKLKIEGVISRNSSILILDMSGILMFQQKMINLKDSTIDISKLHQGYYMLTVKNQQGKIVGIQKFLKKDF